MEIIPVQYDTVSVINNLVNSISERAKAKELRFTVNVDKSLPSVLMGDDVLPRRLFIQRNAKNVKFIDA